MPETKNVEPRTLCFIGSGTFNILGVLYTHADSKWRNKDGSKAVEGDLKERERYITGLALSLGSPASGATFEVVIPKRDILYPQLEALFMSFPETKKLNFTWSETSRRVIPSVPLA